LDPQVESNALTWGALITGSQHRLRAITRAGGCLWLFLALLPYQFASAQANSEETSPEAPFFLEIPEVLSATRLAQHPKDAPAAVFVIDREMIEASGAREIADLLRLAPGFIVASDGGNQRAVSSRGFVDSYGRRLQVLVDGRSVYTPFFGGLSWSDLPLAIDDIARIEVIRGPNGATYGANAFLGVVNIFTRHPDASQGVYARVAGGNIGYRQGTLRHGFTHGPVEVRYTLGHEKDDGFNIANDDEIDGKKLSLATLDAVIQPSANDQIRLQAGVKQGDLDEGGFDIDPATGAKLPTVEDPARTTRLTHAFGQVDWEHDLDDGSKVKVLGSIQQLDRDEDFPQFLPTGHPDNPFPFGVDVGVYLSRQETRYALEAQHLLQPAEGVRVVWGGELRRDEVDSPGYFGPDNPVDNTLVRLFGNLEWRATPEVTVNAGLMLEDYDISGSDLSPRLALNYSPSNDHTFRAAASRSVRAPSMWEARWDQYWPLDFDLSGIGSSGLDGIPETIWQAGKARETPDNETVEALEFGWLFDLSEKSTLRGDIRLFYERYEGLLVDHTYELLTRPDLGICGDGWANFPGPATPGTRIPCVNLNPGDPNIAEPGASITWALANQVDLDMYGIEATLEARPDPRVRLIGSYTLSHMSDLQFTQPGLLDYPYTDGRADPTRLANYQREWGDSVPSNILSLLAIIRPASRLTLSTAIYHVSDMQFLEIGDRTPAYTRIDFRAAYRFRLSDSLKAELYGVVQNAGGDYADFENKNVFETRAFAGIKIYQ
jgi:iron complex outermembrane receptor protein